MMSDDACRAAAKLACFHMEINELVRRTQQRVGDLIDAYGVKGITPNEDPDFAEKSNRALPHIEKIIDKTILDLEKAVQQYYKVGGSERVFKPQFGSDEEN